jgi:LssY C-terminus
MIGTLMRLLWRAFVGTVAVVLAYETTFLFYPYLHHHHFPLMIDLIIIYVLTAYVGIPFLVRLWHLVLRPRHLPLYAVSGDGWSSDPVNIAIVCRNEHQLRLAMEEAGWFIADKATIKNTIRQAVAVIFGRPYPTAPFSNLYLFGRHQDMGFQIQTGSPATPRHRHHIRFWQLESTENINDHATFWQDILHLFTGKRQQIWIGAATHDIGPFAFRVRNLQVTHQIDKETNKEREFVIDTLENAKLIRRREVIAAGNPISFRGQTFRVNIVTDGTLQVLELKNSYFAKKQHLHQNVSEDAS